MHYKNMREYRTWYRESRRQDTNRNDEHFVGADSPEPGGRYGFFELMHGHKAKIENLLTGNMDMADDAQGIYEFIQNAADCEASEFHLFFNDRYFLALNNGFAFTSGGVNAILNIAQSSDDKENPGKIGRYGIGFKLVHRLVGKGNGINELMNDYTGPVIFSWSQAADFQHFLSGAAMQPGSFDPAAAQVGTGAPWLFKILVTCFPAMPGEEVLDLAHQPRVGFTAEELAECRSFLQTCAPTLSLASLGQGSLFFLRLGEGKSAKLRENEQALGNGMRSALHLLGGLQHVAVQGKAVARLDDLHLERFELPADDPRLLAVPLENTRDRRSPLECTFGFAPVEQATALLRTEASFYKYFPVAAEDAPYTFLLHSNLLGIEPNRTQLQPNDINKALLPLAVRLLHERLAVLITANPALARRIWGGLLLSDAPPMGEKHAWQKPTFYDPLLAGLPAAVPTAGGGFRPAAQVKIKQTKLPVELSALGIAGQEWFFWEDKSEPATHAADKLKIERWDVASLLLRGEVEKLNAWIKNLSAADYALLLDEVGNVSTTKWKANDGQLLTRFESLNFFRFPTSWRAESTYYQAWAPDILIFHQAGILPERAAALRGIMDKLQICAFFYDEKFAASPLGGLIGLNATPHLHQQNHLFLVLRQLIDYEGNQYRRLSSPEKWLLLEWLEDFGTDDASLKQIRLFQSVYPNQAELGWLISNSSIPDWLRHTTSDLYSNFKSNEITPEHYAPILDKYLPKRSQLYWFAIQRHINDYNNWEAWKTRLNPANIHDFCRLTVEWYAEATNPGRLPGGQTALTATGWQLAKDVFYHPKLAASADYEALAAAIAALYGEALPVPEMLPWLGTEPFKLDAGTLARAGRAAVLTEPQLTVLRALAEAEGTRLTDHFTLQTAGTDYRLTPRAGGRPAPGYSTDEGIWALLAAFAPDLHLLPLDAHGRALRDEESVLKDAKLLTALLQALPADALPSAAVVAVMSEAGATLVDDWLGQMPRIEIEFATAYPADHAMRRLLEVAAAKLRADKYAGLRDKLFLSVPGAAPFSLSGAAENDEIELENGPERKVKLSRKELLPQADRQSDWVNQLANHLQADKNLRALLGLGEPHDHARLQQQVLAELAADNHTVQNVEQLAYLLLTSQQAEKLGTTNVLAQLGVAGLTGEIYDLNAEWYAAAPDFIEPSCVLALAFVRLPDLLKLSKTKPYAVPGTSFVLLPAPDITAEGLQAPGLRSDSDEAGQKLFLNWLYERWLGREQRKAENKPVHGWPTDWTTLAGVPAAKALGFVPAETVLPAALATAAETPPAWLPAWAVANSPDAKMRFLAALGVNGPDSALARLRHAFRQEAQQAPARTFFVGALNEAGPARQRALRSTLGWLHENGVAVETPWHQKLLTEVFAQLGVAEHDGALFGYLVAHTENEACYTILPPRPATDLLLTEGARQQLQSHGVPLAEMLGYAAEAGRAVLDLSIYPEEWQPELVAGPLAVECIGDRATLQAERAEVPALAAWAAACEGRLYTVAGALPQHRTLLGNTLSARRHGQLWVDEEEGNLYVSAEALPSLPELLEAEAANLFTTEQIAALREALREMNAAHTSATLAETTQELVAVADRLRLLEAENEKLRAEKEMWEITHPLADSYTATTNAPRPSDGIGYEQMLQESADTMTAARHWLTLQPHFDCSAWQASATTVRGVRYHGQPLTLLVKGARYGTLYLSPFEWTTLASAPASALLVQAPGGGFQFTTFAEIGQDHRNDQFWLRFNLRDHSPAFITKLAEFYCELHRQTGAIKTTFLFHQPGAHYTDSVERELRGFFGAALNPEAGPVSAQPDDVL